MAEQTSSPWAVRSVSAGHCAVSPSDLKTLLEMDLIEMRDDALLLTKTKVIKHLIDGCSCRESEL
jgi:hypothetical protein